MEDEGIIGTKEYCPDISLLSNKEKNIVYMLHFWSKMSFINNNKCNNKNMHKITISRIKV